MFSFGRAEANLSDGSSPLAGPVLPKAAAGVSNSEYKNSKT